MSFEQNFIPKLAVRLFKYSSAQYETSCVFVLNLVVSRWAAFNRVVLESDRSTALKNCLHHLLIVRHYKMAFRACHSPATAPTTTRQPVHTCIPAAKQQRLGRVGFMDPVHKQHHVRNSHTKSILQWYDVMWRTGGEQFSNGVVRPL